METKPQRQFIERERDDPLIDVPDPLMRLIVQYFFPEEQIVLQYGKTLFAPYVTIKVRGRKMPTYSQNLIQYNAPNIGLSHDIRDHDEFEFVRNCARYDLAREMRWMIEELKYDKWYECAGSFAQMAARSGSADCVEYITSKCGEENVITSAIFGAILGGNAKICHYLMARMPIPAESKIEIIYLTKIAMQQGEPLQYGKPWSDTRIMLAMCAARAGQIACFNELRQESDKKWVLFYQVAMTRRDEKLLRLLLENEYTCDNVAKWTVIDNKQSPDELFDQYEALTAYGNKNTKFGAQLNQLWKNERYEELTKVIISWNVTGVGYAKVLHQGLSRIGKLDLAQKLREGFSGTKVASMANTSKQ